MSRCGSLRLLVLVLVSVLPACSAIVTYTDLASWQSNATQFGATIDFSILAQTPGSMSILYPSLATYPEATFSSPGDSVQAFNASAAWPWYQWNSGAILRSNASDLGSGAMRVDLTAPATAFAALVGINNGAAGSQMTVNVRSGTVTLDAPVFATSAIPNLTFIGVTSTTPGETFDSITFVPATNYVVLDNVMLGSFNAPPVEPPTGQTPEPGTGLLALCGAGLLAIAKARKFRLRK